MSGDARRIPKREEVVEGEGFKGGKAKEEGKVEVAIEGRREKGEGEGVEGRPSANRRSAMKGKCKPAGEGSHHGEQTLSSLNVVPILTKI